MKTIIYSTLTNNTFLELQYKSIKKYFRSEFEYIIFDDSRETEHITSYNKIQTKSIEQTCKYFGIKYIRLPQELHKNRGAVLPEEWTRKNMDEHPYEDHPVTKCALAVQYGFNYVIKNYKDVYLLLIDSDMFFIDYFNINEYMKNYDIAGIPQSRLNINYLWNGLFICNLNSCQNLKEFNWEAGQVFELDKNNNKTNECIGCDVGGHNYYYLTKYGYLNEKKDKLDLIADHHHDTTDNVLNCGHKQKIKDLLINFCGLKSAPTGVPDKWINKEIIMNCIIHIRGGGGWSYQKEEYHKDCVKIIDNYLYLN